jgi:NAD(P)-dependent dehydrogenase (short-subunit alcohol dehydrogenase family)
MKRKVVIMSELINNREKRKEVLKSILKELHEGKSVEDVKAKFDETFSGVSASEISEAEQALIMEGIAPSEIQKLCDVHAAVFEGSIEEIHKETDPTKIPGHPAYVLVEENKIIADIIKTQITPLLQTDSLNKEKLLKGLQTLSKIELHYLKKENNIFPYLDISKENGEETVRLCKELGADAIFIQADVSKVEDVQKHVAQTVETYEKIDLFFNNAGISDSGIRTIECSIEEFNAIVDVNLKGAFYGLKFVVGEMLKTGGGVIVNTASLGGLVGIPTLGVYSATKHAVVGLTKAIAGEYGRENIRINAIAPGTNETPMVKAYPKEAIQQMAEAVPMGLLG